MKTAEEKAKEKVSWNDVKEKYLKFHRMDKFTENMAIDIDFGYWLANEVISEATRWRDPKEELPPILPKLNYSAPVLAKVKDCNDLQVMCLLLLFGKGEDGYLEYSYVWGTCYGDINGDVYVDDDYDVIAWRPIE